MTATEPTRLLVGVLAWSAPAAWKGTRRQPRYRTLDAGEPVTVLHTAGGTCVVEVGDGSRWSVPAGFVAGAK